MMSFFRFLKTHEGRLSCNENRSYQIESKLHPWKVNFKLEQINDIKMVFDKSIIPAINSIVCFILRHQTPEEIEKISYSFDNNDRVQTYFTGDEYNLFQLIERFNGRLEYNKDKDCFVIWLKDPNGWPEFYTAFRPLTETYIDNDKYMYMNFILACIQSLINLMKKRRTYRR